MGRELNSSRAPSY